MDELKKQVQQLNDLLKTKEINTVDPMDYMERSYAMASKYLNPQEKTPPAPARPEKEPTVAVRKVPDRTVTSLSGPLNDLQMLEVMTRERNVDFNTPVGERSEIMRNAIRARVDEDQVLTNGTSVKLRLSDALSAAGILIPANTVITGQSRINGQRLEVIVSFIEFEGNIIPVELTAHDLDGQKGLYVPDSQERNAMKDAAANMGSSFGTSISFAQSAGQQVAMDLARGVITGGSQYVASKLREVKVSVKANYQLLLISKE